MSKLKIYESFIDNIERKLLRWHCEPDKYEISDNFLTIEADANTDFWQKTNYGFEADNGHFLFCEIDGDFTIETSVDYSFQNQYDQAGLMMRVSSGCWIKTAVEYEPNEPNKLGVVVTNRGYSDWSTQDVEDGLTEFSFRITRKGSDYLIYCRNPKSMVWEQIRMTHIDDTNIVQCGLYACSPKGKGFNAKFKSLDFTKKALSQ